MAPQPSTNASSAISFHAEAALRHQLLAVEKELQARVWTVSPEIWAEERLGDYLWSGQRKLMQSVAKHRKTAAATCHEVGKSFSAARIAAWWLDTHTPGEAFVITTAPTNPQVKVILWKEIGRAHGTGKLRGRVNTLEWKMVVDGKEEIVAMGRKPSDYSPTAFQGIHAPFVLVIVDEANGVRGALWDALESLVANDGGKILAIGNPDDPTGEFYSHCQPGSGWNLVSISAFDSPNFTGEACPPNVARQLIGPVYVEESRRKWAKTWRWTDDGKKVVPPDGADEFDTHPFWQSKVLGRFPTVSGAGTLIPISWLRAAQARDLAPEGPNELGLDVGASEDGDPSCLGHRRGPVFRVLWERREPDTMKTARALADALADAKIGAKVAKVDYTGVGRGTVDRNRELQLPVYPISVGEAGRKTSCLSCHHSWRDERRKADTSKPNCPKCGSGATRRDFANYLSELWWDVRELFENGGIDLDPDDEQLIEELLTLRWGPNNKGQIAVKYGDGKSPNRADALLFTFAPVPLEDEQEWFAL